MNRYSHTFCFEASDNLKSWLADNNIKWHLEERFFDLVHIKSKNKIANVMQTYIVFEKPQDQIRFKLAWL